MKFVYKFLYLSFKALHAGSYSLGLIIDRAILSNQKLANKLKK